LTKVGDGVSGVASAFGSVWLAKTLEGTVIRVDPRTNRIIATIAADQSNADDLDSHLVAAFGSIWENDDEVIDGKMAIYRIDPSTNAVAAKTLMPVKDDMEFNGRPLAAGMGSLWLRTSESTIARIDPSTMRVVQTYPAEVGSSGPGEMVVYGGSLWMANAETDTVWRERITG
jgi:streptogramin lyase